MKNKKRILSLALALLMLFAVVFQMIACGNTGDTDTNTETNDGPNTDTNQGGGTSDKVGYSVVVKSIGGMPLEGVKVYVADKEGNIKKDGIGTTNEKGSVTLNLPRDTGYTISLEDYPEGYIAQESYDMGTTGAVITLASSPADIEDALGASYQLGDIIHDYSITVDGVTYKFSDILKEKKAIILNFWYTTCSYCIEEFPDMDASFKKNSDKVMLFALDNNDQDNIDEVIAFKNSFYYAYYDYTSLRKALVENELTKPIGSAISYELLSADKINLGFEDVLVEVLSADDVSAAKTELADAIEAILLLEKDSKLKTVFAGFAKALKDAESTEEALNAVFADAKSAVYNSFALELPMTKDENHIENAFNVPGNPVTIVIDRYGMISFMHTGAIPNEKYFDALFNYYTVADYQQALFSDISQLSPTVKPNAIAPSAEEYSNTIADGNEAIEFYPETESSDAEFSWPFILANKNGVACVKPSNFDQDTSFATLHAEVTLKAGEALMFDYLASSEYGYDSLYVLVDGKDIYTISGESEDWQGCCPWVAINDGTYKISFVYNKNYSDYEGDDAVYLKNFRIVSKDDVNVESFIPRYATTDLKEDGSDFEKYVDVVLGADGYYHVGTEDGPILLANLIGYTNFSQDTTITIDITTTGSFKVNGVERYNELIQYCNYASNSQLYSYCSVTPELKGYLEAYVDQKIGVGEGNPNQWLTLCSYYDAYGTDGKQLEDPIKGLASFSAYDVSTEKPNVVEYNRVIMPRGLLYKFVPTVSGAYRFTTNSEYEVDGWIFVGNHDEWAKIGDKILYTYSDLGERWCEELLVDPDGDGIMERDYTNSTMVAYMEAGKEYYIDFAYYDQYQYGKFTFDVKYLGESFGHFIAASPGPFTYEEGVNGAQGDTITGGIDVMLGADGYYYHKKADGSQGSRLYADFYQYTSIFTTQSIKDICEVGAFNFSITEVDQMAIAYLARYGEDGLVEYWGDDYEENYKYYQIADVLEGKYHGYYVNGEYKSYGYEYVTDEITGEVTMVLQDIPKEAIPAPDYTALIEKYIDLMLNEEDHPERQGCVEVTEELAEALQLLMDKFTFEGVEHSWTKLCYYYNYLG